VSDMLRTKAFTKIRDQAIVIDRARKLVLVESASMRGAEVALSLLAAAMPATNLHYLVTTLMPAEFMRQVLLSDDGKVAEFSVDSAGMLTGNSPDGQKTTIRLKGCDVADQRYQDLVVDDGMAVGRLDMTWGHRVSFTLAESGAISGLDLHGIKRETGPDAWFGNWALILGEAGQMIDDLIIALGGARMTAVEEAATA
jgi:DNA recombination-dependent growth factor C